MRRPELPALVIAGLAVVGIVVLALLRQPIPDVLTLIASTALGAGAGVALPGGPLARETLQLPARELAAPPALPPVPPPAVSSDTGVFRVARHS